MKQSTGVTSLSGQILSLVSLLSIGVPCNAQNNESSVGGSVIIGSDYTFRGVSQTMGNPSVQASVDIEHSSGLYAYVWGSNVDFAAQGDPDDGARYEIDLAIGYAVDINDKWTVDLALARYLFPDTLEGINYNVSEIMATLWFSEKYSATVAFSDNVDSAGADSLFYELGASFDLPAEMTLQIKYGYYDLRRAYGSAYAYTTTTLARTIGNTTIMLDYVDTYDAADLVFDNRVIGPRYILSVQINW